MGCKYVKKTDEWHGWKCAITNNACMFLVPDSKRCAKEYGEGPDAEINKCEDCKDFYFKNGKRCCRKEHLSWDKEKQHIISSKYIDNEVVCCGGFKKK